ncbi:MAG: helix-turn-helix transcriptional regulator [Saprospiraceae bacterium]|nr:helix-turn-helix transcriptional regulator [Saprospiraceae bacterium]
MTAMIYLTAYLGYVQPSIFNGLNWSDTLTNGKYKNSGLTLEAGQSLLKNLEITMKEECLYHDPEFSLDKLAKHLKAGKHHVSQVINEHLGMSFFEYVNHLRIKEAMQTLTETTRSDMYIIEVAYAVGFNNKMSFNSAFKKATGMTPTEFRRNHGKSDTEPQQPQEAG